MAIIGEQTSFINGISFSDKEGPQNSVAFLRGIDFRSDPKSVRLNPKSANISGSIVTDLPLWGDRACSRTFFYGNTGNIYQRENSTLSLVHTASNSSGNGLAYFTADRSLYYAQNTTFGRLLDACTGASFYDNFLGSEGGNPTNTKSISFNGTTQYASRADTASASITSNLTLEPYIKPSSLPVDTDTMTLISKWDENGNQRSYKLDITTISNFFGDGSDGALTISSNTTDAPIDSACSGTSGTQTLSATNASFSAGQKILIYQSRGTNAGVCQYTEIQAYTAGTITTVDPLDISFSSTGNNKAQVLVMKRYTNVTINAGVTLTAKAWDGSVGGVLAFYANGTLTVSGNMVASEKGFLGGSRQIGVKSMFNETPSNTGEGTVGPRDVSQVSNNGSGGGGGSAGGDAGAGGGGGGNSLAGSTGKKGQNSVGGYGGVLSGSANLTSITFGGGGGAGAGEGNDNSGPYYSGYGGNGGGVILAFAKTIAEVTGTIKANGAAGVAPTGTSGDSAGGGGGGAGGSILFKCQTINYGSNLVTANGGAGGSVLAPQAGTGGAGAEGRIATYYYTSTAGTTNPIATETSDETLGDSDGYALRLQISDDGSTIETHSWDITNYIDTSSWIRPQVTWNASTSTAEAFINAISLGTSTGSMTGIYDSTAQLAVACDFNSSAQNFYAGLMDDVRIWNDIRTDSELLNNNDKKLYGTEANLVAYYEFESDVTDSQSSGLNDLTATGTPTYSNDIPFTGLTARQDQDQSLDTSGDTYALGTSIDEGATHRQTFVPAKDPQKSIEVNIAAVGTGDWTLTVHDALNREVASVTIDNGDLHTGVYEFIFSSVWRPIIGASYHFHLTSTVADGTVVATSSNDLETGEFFTHYQFLVEDEYHPIEEFLDFMVIGNERYVAKFEAGDVYDPHRLTFPSGYRVRCIAYWREFIVFGCWKGSAITDFDDGRIFFWDGVNDTYNHSIPIPEGGVNTMFGTQDVLFISAGYTGELLVYTGGGSATKFNKFPKLATGDYIECAPGAMNMWRSNIHIGVGINGDSEDVHRGVYSIGSSNAAYPASLGFDYPTSLGDQTSSNVKVGMVYPSGQGLYTGWQNGNAFGIDEILPTNDPYNDGTIELLVSDLGTIAGEEYPFIARADFNPLNSGESVRMKYKADREDNWNEGEFEDTVGAKNTRMIIHEKCREIQVAVDLRTTVSTSPVVLGVSLETDLDEGGIRG